MTFPSPHISFEWDVADMPSVSRRVHNRRLSIQPRKLTVHTRGRQGDLSVYIEGDTIKANGERGQHRRTIGWSENPSEWFPQADFRDLPAWAVPFLHAVRERLSASHPDRSTT
jgi:hypothetical protein